MMIYNKNFFMGRKNIYKKKNPTWTLGLCFFVLHGQYGGRYGPSLRAETIDTPLLNKDYSLQWTLFSPEEDNVQENPPPGKESLTSTIPENPFFHGHDEKNSSQDDSHDIYTMDHREPQDYRKDHDEKQWIKAKKEDIKSYRYYRDGCKKECSDLLFYVLPMAAFTGNVWHSYRSLKMLCLVFFIDRWQNDVVDREEAEESLYEGKISIKGYIRYKERLNFYAFLYALFENHHVMIQKSSRPLVDLFTNRDYSVL